VFGDLYLLAERMHPNADGQELVAESVPRHVAEAAVASFAGLRSTHAGTVERH
jgi:hypothetical protein